MGGWKSQKTAGVRLDPETVRATLSVFHGVISGWNKHLVNKGLAPVQLIRPVGSVSYYEQDIEDDPERIYGDIDYLVSFPFDEGVIDDDTGRRNAENATKRVYMSQLASYLRDQQPPQVDIDDTLRGSPALMILKLPDGRHVQVDVIVTFPKYRDWMLGRYTPERTRKGLVMGKLYKALGDVLVLSIGTEGVIARTRDGQRVPSKFRKGVSVDIVSTDIRNFLVDIAKYLIGQTNIQIDSLLQKNPGVQSENVTLHSLLQGIVGLGKTLEKYDVVPDAQEFSAIVAKTYEDLMSAELSNPKYKKAMDPEQFAAIEKVKSQVATGISDANSALRSSVAELTLRSFVREVLLS